MLQLRHLEGHAPALTRFASGVVRGTSAHSLLARTSHLAPTYCVGLWNVQKHVGVCSLGNEGQGYIERVRLMLRFGALAVMSFLLFPFEEAFLDISEDGRCSYKENLDLM